MKAIELKGRIREVKGKGPCRQLRSNGWLPGILYGNRDNIPICLELKQLRNVLAQGVGENTLLELNLEGDQKGSRHVIIRELQVHPVTREILHIDLFELSLERRIEVNVPIVLVGEPLEVTQGEGILHHQLKEITLECLPTEIPENISIDISGLKIGDVIHVRDLQLAKGLKVLTDPDMPIVSVSGVAKEEAEGALEETPTEGTE